MVKQVRTMAWAMTGLLAACSSGSELGANDGRDAAGAVSGGATAQGGRGSEGGSPGGGGATATGLGGAGTGGTSGTGGGAGSSVPKTGAGGVSAAAGGKTSAGGGSGSAGAKAGTGGALGTGGMVADAASRDAGTAFDDASERPRADASPSDRAVQDAVADASGGDGLSAAAQEYVKAFAEPYCTRLAECCKAQGFATPGLAACEANELLFVKHLDDGSVVMDATTIQTILAQLQDSCDQPSYTLLGSTTQGTRSSGEACESVSQCTSNPALCLSQGGGGSGTCMTPPRGKTGDGCTVTCDDATLCKWGTSGGKSPYAICYEEDGLRCDTDTETCVPLTAPGAPCSDFTECGSHADCTNGTCQAKQKLGGDCGNGAMCDRGLQCASSGGSAFRCEKLSIAWSGSCSP